MDVLILSSPQDVHYRAVDWALRKIGLKVGLLFGNCFPQYQAQSLTISDASLGCEARIHNGEMVDLLAPAIVWYRRGHWPIISPDLSDVDREAAEREAEMFVGGLRSLLALEQRWINDPDSEAAANRKPYQLCVAKRMGLSVPRTIMSNDPAKIKEFLDACGGQAILKPFRAMQWINAEQHLILFARKLRFEEIEDPSALCFTSQIFQEYVEKLYELRIFYFGGHILPVKLNSQSDPSTRIDWRVSTDGVLRPELVQEIPGKVRDAIERYMKHMGLEYGAFDFIVRPDGEHVFLECNVSGQFLFVEEWNPEIRILAEFIRFLTRELDLKPEQRDAARSLRYLDFYHSAETVAHYEAISAEYPLSHVSQNLHREGKAS